MAPHHTYFLALTLISISHAFLHGIERKLPHGHISYTENVGCNGVPASTHHQHPTALASSIFDAPSAAALPSIVSAPALLSVTVTYLSLIFLLDRPRGTLPARDALSIAQSRVPNAGLGLFVTQPLPEGTVLGTYPGVLRRQADFYDGKCRMYPKAVYYSWRLNDSGCVLDPTDSRGEIQSYCFGGSDAASEAVFTTILRFWAKPTDLARINEPPIGFGGCNVIAREEKESKCVRFELCRDVDAGEELFMDYGLDYDRSGYGQ